MCSTDTSGTLSLTLLLVYPISSTTISSLSLIGFQFQSRIWQRKRRRVFEATVVSELSKSGFHG
ncbi:hypothetical protein N665_0123s0041 [Sinapis alba]|nr:hypothetical protein N665_0123s0041 [Sinapis alba]